MQTRVIVGQFADRVDQARIELRSEERGNHVMFCRVSNAGHGWSIRRPGGPAVTQVRHSRELFCLRPVGILLPLRDGRRASKVERRNTPLYPALVGDPTIPALPRSNCAALL